MQPVNQAAQLIINAQSVIGDLITQAAEIQRAIDRQQTVIDQLMPVAVWEQPATVPDVPAPEEPPVAEPEPEPVEIVTYPEGYADPDTAETPVGEPVTGETMEETPVEETPTEPEPEPTPDSEPPLQEPVTETESPADGGASPISGG